ncbi:pollen-specific leucine-rich repeat extensin-like protein 1 [Rhinolophus ferrumequinum]|uniref:pollen-specific leucine-rich repeat extensin-like protein 1 n=1 Tax=Rhinolophus ferrumequinum TaxID=59479 RepID=UPI00140FF5DB|nr:pollen-specific leucine-rich repeat extensin-like protein 1 [Rhinolophus ferrumequinum]
MPVTLKDNQKTQRLDQGQPVDNQGPDEDVNSPILTKDTPGPVPAKDRDPATSRQEIAPDTQDRRSVRAPAVDALSPPMDSPDPALEGDRDPATSRQEIAPDTPALGMEQPHLDPVPDTRDPAVVMPVTLKDNQKTQRLDQGQPVDNQGPDEDVNSPILPKDTPGPVPAKDRDPATSRQEIAPDTPALGMEQPHLDPVPDTRDPAVVMPVTLKDNQKPQRLDQGQPVDNQGPDEDVNSPILPKDTPGPVPAKDRDPATSRQEIAPDTPALGMEQPHLDLVPDTRDPAVVMPVTLKDNQKPQRLDQGQPVDNQGPDEDVNSPILPKDTPGPVPAKDRDPATSRQEIAPDTQDRRSVRAPAVDALSPPMDSPDPALEGDRDPATSRQEIAPDTPALGMEQPHLDPVPDTRDPAVVMPVTLKDNQKTQRLDQGQPVDNQGPDEDVNSPILPKDTPGPVPAKDRDPATSRQEIAPDTPALGMEQPHLDPVPDTRDPAVVMPVTLKDNQKTQRLDQGQPVDIQGPDEDVNSPILPKDTPGPVPAKDRDPATSRQEIAPDTQALGMEQPHLDPVPDTRDPAVVMPVTLKDNQKTQRLDQGQPVDNQGPDEDVNSPILPKDTPGPVPAKDRDPATSRQEIAPDTPALGMEQPHLDPVPDTRDPAVVMPVTLKDNQKTQRLGQGQPVDNQGPDEDVNSPILPKDTPGPVPAKDRDPATSRQEIAPDTPALGMEQPHLDPVPDTRDPAVVMPVTLKDNQKTQRLDQGQPVDNQGPDEDVNSPILPKDTPGPVPAKDRDPATSRQEIAPDTPALGMEQPHLDPVPDTRDPAVVMPVTLKDNQKTQRLDQGQPVDNQGPDEDVNSPILPKDTPGPVPA